VTNHIEQDRILLEHPPQSSERFFCNNCHKDRDVKDKRVKIVLVHGRTHPIIKCKYCIIPRECADAAPIPATLKA
jgi:nitrate/TMAO reductase-like tetraheme cytochrome c subunit